MERSSLRKRKPSPLGAAQAQASSSCYFTNSACSSLISPNVGNEVISQAICDNSFIFRCPGERILGEVRVSLLTSSLEFDHEYFEKISFVFGNIFLS